MKLDIREEESVTIISVEGEIDASNSSEIGDSLDGLLDDGRKKLIVDLERVKFIDSSGLGVLVRAYKHARAESSDISLAGLQPPVLKVFTLTRLDRVFEIHPDVAQALQKSS